MHRIELNQSAVAVVDRSGRPAQHHPALPPNPIDHINLANGEFVVDHYRKGKRIGSYRFKNGITNQGKNKLLDVMFHADTQITAWFLGLIDNSGFSALAAADTYASHAGWAEFDDYTDDANSDSAVTRPAWTEGAASGQSITNSSVIVFDITATGTVKGVFVVGGGSAPSTKNDTAGGGTLWSTALFSGGDVPVLNGDALRVTYTVSA